MEYLFDRMVAELTSLDDLIPRNFANVDLAGAVKLHSIAD